MAITYISSTDPFVGYNHPFYPNIIYRAGAYIKAQFEVEHNSDGTHPNREHGLIVEEGTYVGNATDNREISLSNSDLTPLWVAFYADSADRIHTDAYNVDGTIYEPVNDMITAMDTGSFTITNHEDINTDSQTYYYVVLGYDNTSTWTGTASGSDPTWIEDGDSLDADVAGTGTLNQVAKHIEDVFLDEHNDNGTHKNSPFDFFIETIAWTPNGNDDRDITLDENIDIKAIWCQGPNALSYRTHKMESIAGDSSQRTNASFGANDQIQSIGTGTFQVGVQCNGASWIYFACVIGE